MTDLRHYGYDAPCLYRAGCPNWADWAVAEACNPALLSGPATFAFYCDLHVAAAPIAAFEAVKKAAGNAADSPDGDLWPALLANYPNPIPAN